MTNLTPSKMILSIFPVTLIQRDYWPTPRGRWSTIGSEKQIERHYKYFENQDLMLVQCIGRLGEPYKNYLFRTSDFNPKKKINFV